MTLNDAPYDLVAVTWDDAEVDAGWDKVGEPKEALVLTVGFLVKKTRKHLVIAASVTTGEHNTNQRIQIPRGMLVSMETLRKGTPDKTSEVPPRKRPTLSDSLEN